MEEPETRANDVPSSAQQATEAEPQFPTSSDDTTQPILEQQHLEADLTESDSAYGESTKSSFLTSIASEVTRGMVENGRRYHSYGSGEYGFPNDDRECKVSLLTTYVLKPDLSQWIALICNIL